MVTCLTGALLVFETELQHLFFKHRYYVSEMGTTLTADSLINSVATKIPGVKISGIKTYADKGRTVEVSLMQPTKKKEQSIVIIENRPNKKDRKAIGLPLL